MALSEAAKVALYLRELLNEILGNTITITLFNNNQGTQKLAHNPVFDKRTKHIDTRHHFIRETIEAILGLNCEIKGKC